MLEEDCPLHVYTWNYVVEKVCIQGMNVYVAIHWPTESICIGIERVYLTHVYVYT